jgi:general secretion pathway protein K
MAVDGSKGLLNRRRVGSRRGEKGVAMIIAVIAIAVLTAVATEFVYNSRVDLQLATNQRDEIRAYYLARSGIGLSRLLLRFQKQLDNIQLPNLQGLLSQLTGPGGPAGALLSPAGPAGSPPGAATAAGGGGLTLQLWRMARIDCQMLQQMVKQEPRFGEQKPLTPPSPSKPNPQSPDLGAAQVRRSFGGFEGCFLATIGSEEEKLNLNKLDAPQFTSQVVVSRLLDLLGDKRFEFVFEKEDSNRVKVTPNDVVLTIHDWIDDDEVQSALNLTGKGDPFVKGFSDENSLYDRYVPRYKAKNAHFDTLDELYMVHGVNDRFMAAFRDRFTVYPDINAGLNVNTDDPIMLRMVILSMVDPLKIPAQLQDPLFLDELIRRIRASRVLSVFGTTVADLTNILQTAGVPVNPALRSSVQANRWLSDKSSTFQIKSVGEAGNVQKTLTAVVRMDDGALGRLVYWREE